MVMMAGYDLPIRAIREQLSSALELVVHLERMDDGSRKVTSITEVQRMEGDVIMLQDLFSFRFDGVGPDRTVHGELQPTGLRPAHEGKFRKHGIDLNPELFGMAPLTQVAAR
jgi:pilus assembly protein CpaF